MKKNLCLILIAALLGVGALSATAQTNVITVTNVVTTTNTSILGNGVLNGLYQFGSAVLKTAPTNLVAGAYGTYAPPKAPGQKTWGYGALVGYNFSQNVGLYGALDVLDKTTLVNGQIMLKTTVHPFQNLPLIHLGTNTFFYKLAVTPNVLGGVVSDIANGGTQIGTVEGTGASANLWQIGSGYLVLDYEYTTMSLINLQTTRQRHQLFLGYSVGF